MSHHLILDSLKRLLMCTRCKPHATDSSPAASATSTESENCGSSADSARCQPLFTLSELRRRERLQLGTGLPASHGETFPSRLTQVPEESESARTLGSGSMDLSEREALIASLANGGEWQVTGTADSSGTLSERRILRQSLGCQAEICHMSERCDRCSNVRDPDAYNLARVDDLVIAEYTQGCANRKPKVVNNVPISYQHELNAELCEVNQSNSPSVYLEKTVHVSTNLSNVALHRPSHASHQNGCRRSPLQVQVQSDESEPRTTCASVSNSRAPSYEPLSAGFWPDDFANNAANANAAATAAAPATPTARATPAATAAAIPTPAAGDASTYSKACGSAEAGFSTALRDDECGSVPLQTNDNIRNLSDEAQLCVATSGTSDRFGNLSADWCSNLCQSLVHGGRGLLHQYLAKRDIDEVSREVHRQRCGRITAELVEKLLRIPVGASPAVSRSQALAAAEAAMAVAEAGAAESAEAAVETAARRLDTRKAQIPTPKWLAIVATARSCGQLPASHEREDKN